MGKLGLQTLFFSGFLTSCITCAALACSPDPDQTYDRIIDQDGVIAIATVVAISATPTSDGGSCRLVSYAVKRAIFGAPPDQLSVRICDKNISVERMMNFPGIPQLGFVSGAIVIVGLVRTGLTDSGWRYAVPGCWGVLHIRLDNLSKNERSTLIHAINKITQDYTGSIQYDELPASRGRTAESRLARKPNGASPTSKTPAASTAGPYVVQLASRKNKADALEVFADLQEKYPSLLNGYGPIIQSANLGNKGVWYRLNVGPIESNKVASSLCSQLKNAGMRHCLVRQK